MRVLWMVVALLLSTNGFSQPDQEAVLGNGGQGGGGGETARDAPVERAMELAKQSGRQFPTVEQLLLGLLDDESVRTALVGQSVDIDSVRASLLQYVALQPVDGQNVDSMGRDPKVTNAMRRAMLKSVAANREALPTDLVVAILVEGDSFAARTLADHGLTVQEAEDASVNHYLAVQKETDARMAEAQRRIAAEASRPRAGGPAQIAMSAVSSPMAEPKRYTLRVTSSGPNALRFKAALSRDGALDLYIETTPFEIPFTARRIAALFEAIDYGSLKVELLTDVEGVPRTVAGFGGTAGAVFEDPYDRMRQQSGVLR